MARSIYIDKFHHVEHDVYVVLKETFSFIQVLATHSFWTVLYHGRLGWFNNHGMVCGLVVIASTACSCHDLEVCRILKEVI